MLRRRRNYRKKLRITAIKKKRMNTNEVSTDVHKKKKKIITAEF